MSGPSSPDPLTAWRTVAAGWERQRPFVWDSSREVGEMLVEMLGPQRGDTVLELAAGPGDTGFVAAARVGEGGLLISSDFAPEMVEAARRRAAELGVANAEFRVLDAQALELPDDGVDGVLCRWGYMLMPEPPRAFEETFRVLRPGGGVAFSVWADADENVWASAVGRALLELGLMEPPEPDAPGPFRLADVDRLRALVLAAGFEDPRIEDQRIANRYSSFDHYWAVATDLSFQLTTALQTSGVSVVEQARALVQGSLQPYEGEDGSLTIPGLCRNVHTVKPAARIEMGDRRLTI